MKKLNEYFEEIKSSKVSNKKPKTIMAPQGSIKEELWNSQNDRWSRNAKHPINVNDVLAEEDISEISTSTLKSYMDKANASELPGYGGKGPFTDKDIKRGNMYTKAGDIVNDRENPIENPAVHDFSSNSDEDVYNATQTDNNINDGDILNLSDGRKAILYKSWPIMVVGTSNILHSLKDGVTWDSFRRGRYAKAAELAKSINNPESLTEGIMGGVKPIASIGRMMQLAGVAYDESVSEDDIAEDRIIEEVIITEDALTTQLVNSNMNGEFKNNPVAAKIAAIGQLMVAASPLVEDIKNAADNSVTPDMMNKLKAAIALGATFITNARTMVNTKTE